MRNAALMLGVIGGLIGMAVGFFSIGYMVFLDWLGDTEALYREIANPDLIRVVGFAAPILAIAGGAMARSQATVGGVCMILSAAGMFHAFGFSVFTMFPIGMCGLGGVLALSARQPDIA